MSPRIAESAQVDPTATVGYGAVIWDLAQLRDGCIVGEGSVLGRGSYIGSGVRVGRNCKIQNYALIYEPAELGDGVFIGPAAVLTNDVFPRAVNPDESLKSGTDWQPVGVQVDTGASIGAGAVCVAPARIGAWSVIAAGAVVIDNVPDFALMAGVPARRIKWVGRAGVPLNSRGDGSWQCGQSGELYKELDGLLVRCEENDA